MGVDDEPDHVSGCDGVVPPREAVGGFPRGEGRSTLALFLLAIHNVLD